MENNVILAIKSGVVVLLIDPNNMHKNIYCSKLILIMIYLQELLVVCNGATYRIS